MNNHYLLKVITHRIILCNILYDLLTTNYTVDETYLKECSNENILDLLIVLTHRIILCDILSEASIDNTTITENYLKESSNRNNL